jgi:Uma2 family endonuclease
LFEPELHLGQDIVVPDLAGWRRDRFDPSWIEGAYFSVAPDWVCEVLSPGNAVNDRLEKLPIYAAAGIHHAWFVHPVYRSLEVFRLDGGKWVSIATHIGTAKVRAEPFEAIELDLARLWRDQPPRPSRASEAWDQIL